MLHVNGFLSLVIYYVGALRTYDFTYDAIDFDGVHKWMDESVYQKR